MQGWATLPDSPRKVKTGTGATSRRLFFILVTYDLLCLVFANRMTLKSPGQWMGSSL